MYTSYYLKEPTQQARLALAKGEMESKRCHKLDFVVVVEHIIKCFVLYFELV